MSLQNRAGWLMTVAGGVCLGAAGVGLSQSHVATVPVLAPAPVHAPDDLSAAFRETSAKVLPSVVSISTETKARRVTGPGGGRRPQGGPDSEMFRQFFGNDPRFEQFFGEGGEGGGMMTPRQQGAGSGFIVDSSGIVLTNSHVVEGADQVVVTLHDGREIEAESWNFDPRSDVAIIRLKKTDEPLPPGLILGNSDQMQVGDWVLAMGNPFQLGNTVTTGIISATGRGPHINEREQFIQTDAAINPGNSGGPLVNLFGEVIGINTAISTRSGGYDGVGFAIPSRNARWVADQLIQKGDVRRSYLGVGLTPLTRELRNQLNAPSGKGVVITSVKDNGPAAKAKLQPGDIILSFGGSVIKDVDQLTDTIERAVPNVNQEIVVLREGKEMKLDLQLEEMPSGYTEAMRRARVQDRPREQSQPASAVLEELGVELTDLTPAVASQLKLEGDVKGVVVKAVQNSSVAGAAGLQAGDVIHRVGLTDVASLKEFEAAVSKLDLSKGVPVQYRRGDGKAFTILKQME